MTAASTIKTWYLVHKWTSLVCTAFLLIICLTGLPLIFSHEIEDLLDDAKPYAELPANTPMANLDTVLARAQARYPTQVATYAFIDDDDPQILVGMAPGMRADLDLHHTLRFDARTAELLKDGPLQAQEKFSFMGIMLALHRDLYAGLAGELFLGLMGLLFVVAIVSGVVLYGPFMKKLPFGTIRGERSRRLKWLDLHNLLGVVTLAWGLVVGLTGVINELSTPLFGLWQASELPRLMAPYKGMPPPAQPSSVQAAYETAQKAVPAREVTSVTFPGSPYGTPNHYVIWTRGNTPLTSRLFTPVLVDAGTGQLTAVAEMPWYLKALEVSRPLHFGDYAGLPLKILWTLLDLVSIVVLASGLYLWLARRKATDARVAELMRRHAGDGGVAA
jgi:uncharacterized iron-regulated membrane protein